MADDGALFDYLAQLFWQAVTGRSYWALQEALSWLDPADEDEWGQWGQCDVCLTYVPVPLLSERDRHRQQYCPECRS